ncbi:sensor histidine kinase [Priestia megaterium]|uniref:sensor histidine kinase n=1 Tax=Priestia megaterium TaxID=1404 RepID=UPI0025709088|nr:HAMP domain-containing sensor histidine kinase [Priestia megaterium]WJD83558.1 HAMP domain-containing sensor histidine kinase [Priestia megaterium]
MFNKIFFRKQQLKFMLLNLIAFTIIFTIFSVIIFSEVQRTLFIKVDTHLSEFKETNTGLDNIDDDFDHAPKDKELDPDFLPKARKTKDLNPRFIVIHWDKAGNIINKDEIGTRTYENYFKNYKFDKTNMNKIMTTEIDNLYYFRYILFKDDNEGDQTAYTQIMINVDPEQTIISNLRRLVIICSVIFIVLSISASFILSRKMMKPIIKSWNKQAEFVENASHELRTPLTIIQNKLEFLLTTPQAKIVDKFENIALSLSETRHLSKLTTDLLTLARADSAETEIIKQSVHVDTFIQSVCAPYKEIAESQNKHFWLNLECPITVKVDDTRFHQLLVILLDNALKYTGDNDSIGVKTYVEDQKVAIEVSDSGMGIKEENIRYIFDRFYREDKARSRETGGAGLGLSIAQWIVAKHNGTIKAIKNQNKGTTFKVKLPK